MSSGAKVRGPSARFVAVICAITACATGQRPGAPDQPVVGSEATVPSPMVESEAATEREADDEVEELVSGEFHVVYEAAWSRSSLRLDTRARTLEFAECMQGPWTFALTLTDAWREELRESFREVGFLSLPARITLFHPDASISCSPPSDVEIEVSAGERRHRIRRDCVSGGGKNDVAALLSRLQAIVEATLASAGYEHKVCNVH